MLGKVPSESWYKAWVQAVYELGAQTDWVELLRSKGPSRIHQSRVICINQCRYQISIGIDRDLLDEGKSSMWLITLIGTKLSEECLTDSRVGKLHDFAVNQRSQCSTLGTSGCQPESGRLKIARPVLKGDIKNISLDYVTGHYSEVCWTLPSC